jgi:hypothetical protein
MAWRTILTAAATLGVGLAVTASLGSAAPAERPRNTAPPTLSGTPQQGETLTAEPGGWAGTEPIVFAYRWQRCNAEGANCVGIGASGRRYTLRPADVGTRVRVRVTARNAAGSRSAVSAPGAVVAAAPAPPPPGSTVPASSVSLPQRLVVSAVEFAPAVVRSRTAPVTVRVVVSDTRGYRVSGALAFVRSTPLVTSAAEATTGADGAATIQLVPEDDFSLVYRRGYSLQVFVRARKPGDPPLAGVSTSRLVQVPIAPG